MSVVEKEKLQTQTLESLRAAQAAKRVELQKNLPPEEEGAKEKVSAGRGKSGRSKPKRPPTPEELEQIKFARRNIRKLFSVIRVLKSDKYSKEQKDKATDQYVALAAELLMLKYVSNYTEYIEEINFGAASTLWLGRRGYNVISGPFKAFAGMASLFGGWQQQEEIKESEVKLK